MARLALFIAAFALAAAPASAALKARAMAKPVSLTGNPLGTVVFDAVKRGVLVTFDLHDLPPGAHAVHASTVASGFSIGNGKRSIFDRDGVALILDARGDDYRTQPLGNAGDRIACGVVIRTRGPAKWDGVPRRKTK